MAQHDVTIISRPSADSVAEQMLRELVTTIMTDLLRDIIGNGGGLFSLNTLHSEKRILSDDPTECFSNIFHMLATSEIDLTIDETSKRISLFHSRELWWITHHALRKSTYANLIKLCRTEFGFGEIAKTAFDVREYTGTSITRIYNRFRFNDILTQLMNSNLDTAHPTISIRARLCEQFACICVMNYVFYLPSSVETENAQRFLHILSFLRVAITKTNLLVHEETYQESIGLTPKEQPQIDAITGCLQHLTSFVDSPPFDVAQKVQHYLQLLLQNENSIKRWNVLRCHGHIEKNLVLLEGFVLREATPAIE